jgi:hypothetical protein
VAAPSCSTLTGIGVVLDCSSPSNTHQFQWLRAVLPRCRKTRHFQLGFRNASRRSHHMVKWTSCRRGASAGPQAGEGRSGAGSELVTCTSPSYSYPHQKSSCIVHNLYRPSFTLASSLVTLSRHCSRTLCRTKLLRPKPFIPSVYSFTTTSRGLTTPLAQSRQHPRTRLQPALSAPASIGTSQVRFCSCEGSSSFAVMASDRDILPLWSVISSVL